MLFTKVCLRSLFQLYTLNGLLLDPCFILQIKRNIGLDFSLWIIFQKLVLPMKLHRRNQFYGLCKIWQADVICFHPYSLLLYLLFHPIDLIDAKTSLNLDSLQGFLLHLPFIPIPEGPLILCKNKAVSSVKY